MIRRLGFGLLVAACALIVLASPRAVESQNLVYNQPVTIAATAIPTNGITASIGQPAVAVYSGWFTNSSASAVFCGFYGSPPSLGTTPLVGGQVAVPAGSTQPLYLGPTNGINKSFFPNGIYAGCSTTYLGSTGVAQSTVGVAVTFL